MTDDSRSWACEHFSQANPEGSPEQADVGALLRRVAATLDSLGPVEVSDLVLHSEITDDGDHWPSITVYFTRP